MNLIDFPGPELHRCPVSNIASSKRCVCEWVHFTGDKEGHESFFETPSAFLHTTPYFCKSMLFRDCAWCKVKVHHYDTGKHCHAPCSYPGHLYPPLFSHPGLQEKRVSAWHFVFH